MNYLRSDEIKKYYQNLCYIFFIYKLIQFVVQFVNKLDCIYNSLFNLGMQQSINKIKADSTKQSTDRQTGRRYDYMIYKKNHLNVPKEVLSMFDLGFLGVEEDSPQQLSSLPFKKEKDCELCVSQKKSTQ